MGVFQQIQTQKTQPTGTGLFGQIQSQQAPHQSPQPSQVPDGLMNHIAGALGSFFGGDKLGEAVGNSLYGLGAAASDLGPLHPNVGRAVNDITDAGQANAKIMPQVAGDVAKMALTAAAPLTGGATALGRIGSNAALGAGLTGANAIASGQNAGTVAKETAAGGVLGGGLGAVGEVLTKLPTWFTKAALPKLNPDSTAYALANTRIGQSADTLLSDSNSAIRSYEGQVQSVLSHPEHIEMPEYRPASILGDVLSNFPNSNYTPNDIITNAQNIAPKVGKLLDKFETGTANLQEINTIRKELDAATKSVYTTVNRPPESKALGAALANALRDTVQTNAPETKPIFANYSKEIGLNQALTKVVKKNQLRPTLKDFAAAFGGYEVGGFKGAAMAVAAERLGNSAAAKLTAGKAVDVATKAAPLVRGVKAPIMNAITSQINR